MTTPDTTTEGAPAPNCGWHEELRPVGIDPELPVGYRIGVSLLALALFTAAGAWAVLGGAPSPAGAVLLTVAAAPWAVLLAARRDHGPTWWFALLCLVPAALLGVGQWSAVPLGLGSEPALLLALLPLLLAVLLFTGFPPPRKTAVVVTAAYAVVTLPALAGWVLGGQAPGIVAALAWHIGFAFCLVAGGAIRFTYATGRELSRAREALAWQAAERERHRAAQDVHDVVAHTLAVTMLHLTAARMAVRRADLADAEDALEEAERQGRASLADVRRVVRLLKDGEAAASSPQPTLAEIPALVEGYRAAGLDIEFTAPEPFPSCSASAQLGLYRVAQEALANAVRHGTAPVEVRLAQESGDVLLEIANPLPADVGTPGLGSGLTGMRERVQAAGGRLEAGVRHDRWLVVARVPGTGAADTGSRLAEAAG